jgi:predicted AAA+ superfamily ATPase
MDSTAPLVRERFLAQLRPFYDQNGLVKILTGIRRSGKSVILQEAASELRQRVGADRVIELNFELTELSQIATAQELDRYVSNLSTGDGTYYVFLDEVQEVADFEKAVNSLRARGNLSVFISGSNARLLSGELATYLSGRYVQIQVWPLSLVESLELRGIEPSSLTQELLTDFLRWGGMPQRFSLGANEQRAYLRDVFNSVVLRDVVQRSGIRDLDSLETILDFAMENLGRVLSPSSISKYLESQKRRIAVDTIYTYLRALTDGMLLNRVRRYDLRGKRVMETLDKYYATDVGILATKQVGNGPGIGDLIENAVYVALAGRGFDVFTGKTPNGEIDFVAVKDSMPRYVQVAYLIADEEVAEREFGAFNTIKDAYPRFVISADPFPQSRDGITHLSLTDFLLNPPQILA